ncbi:phage terminase small subunit P27 family [Lysobacter rhizosphaerae]
MRGRKPKPTHLKLLNGNPGRRPINRAEPLPKGDLHEAPEWLSDSQRAGWAYAIASAPAALLKRIDRALLTIWVVAEDLHREASEAINANGAIITTRNGERAQNPYMAVMNRQVPVMLKAASELGFTPASRSRIQLPDGDGKKPGGPFAQFKPD